MHVANITIDKDKVDSDLTDFPIYIDLSDLPSSFWDTVVNGGGDIRVYKSDGTTELAREVVSCDTGTDTGEMHIKYSGTLSGSSDTTIQIHADGSSSEPASDATYGSEAVWSSDYKAVYHLTDFNDSTSNDNNGTNNGATSGAIGKIGDAYSFDGNDYIDTSLATFTTPYSFSYWLKTDSLDEYHFGNYNGTEKDIYSDIQADNQIRIVSDISSDIFGGNIQTGTWYHIVNVLNSSGHYLYINGVEEASGNGVANDTDSSSGANLNLGDVGDERTGFEGDFDEVKILNTALSADWISTEYNNQSDTSTFYTTEAVITLTGQITLNEVGVSATVMGYNETTDTFLGYSVTDGSGNYTFTWAGVTGDIILVAAQHDGAEKYGRVKTIELS